MAFLSGVFGGTDTGALKTGAGKANKLLRKGIKQATSALDTGQSKGISSIAAGLSAANPIYKNAANNFDPYMQSGQSLNNLYTGALGGNGQPGYDAAQAAFHTAPGYNFLQQQGEQGILRNNAATGGVASGNTLTDLSKFNIGLADQSYQEWLNNLFRGGEQGLQAGTAQAGVLQNLGEATNQAGRDTAGIYTGTAGKLADVYTGGRSAQATNQYNLGLGLQNQTAADQASQLSLINSIIGAAGKAAGSFAA